VTDAARQLCATILAIGGMGLLLSAQPRTQPAPRGTATGTITGHIALTGSPPGNPVIRMGLDPKCTDMNAGRQVIQEQAMVAADGSVANAFVRLEGTFPATPVPTAPVVIDQRACLYGPRVVGVRVGQPLQIRNDDNLLHNVHASSVLNNSFNVGQPRAGLTYEFTPQSPEVMLKLGCDVHRWMVAFVGVTTHPYFAVSAATGRYTITQVPAGTYTIRSWHEQFGDRAQTITVRSGSTATADFTYGAAPGGSGRQGRSGG